MDITIAVICEWSFVSDRQWQLTWYYTNAEIFNYIASKNKILKITAFKSSMNFSYSFL